MKKQKVRGFYRKGSSGRSVKVPTYRRKIRKKAHGTPKPMKKEYVVRFYQDSNGQIVSKRYYRPFRS